MTAELNPESENNIGVPPPVALHEKHFTFRQTEIIKRAIRKFSVFEKTIFFGLVMVMFLSAGTLVLRINDLFVEEVPVLGGEFREGVIGSARFINPILAISDSDRDITSLIYSGLMRSLPDGSIVPDLAESYEISEDGKTYTFILKENLTFHDGNPLSTEDIEYTISRIQDSAIKSPKRPNWESVTLEKIDEREIRFHLRQPYAPFLENTTVGIVPKNIWKDVTSEEYPLSLFNFEPIGSGPYKIDSIERNKAGLPQTYVLSAFKDFALGRPYLKEVHLSFYPNEASLFEAYSRGEINAIHSVTPENLPDIQTASGVVLTSPLPRIFGVFFNQNQATIFADQKIREALNISVDRQQMVEEVLSGYGVPIYGPLPPEAALPSNKEIENEKVRIEKAREILTKDGWILNPATQIFEKSIKRSAKVTEKIFLSFSLSTGSAPELKKTAELLKDIWQKVGVQVEVKVFETGDLNQNIIRPRKYDALLFGEVIGRDLDLFAFWHSSQRNDPGLNIAMYTNSKIDKILEEARGLTTALDRLKRYQEFAKEIAKETPAVFLYSPDFIYLLPPYVKGATLKNVTIPSDRYLGIHTWYIESEKVWKFFVKE